MGESSNEQKLPWGTLLILVVVGIVLRVNLPPANVSKALDLSGLEKEDWFTRVAVGTTAKLAVTDPVARWHYRDFIVLRVATSQRLNMTAIGLPFCKWFLFDNEAIRQNEP